MAWVRPWERSPATCRACSSLLGWMGMVVIATTAAEQCICLGELWSLLDATRWRGLQQLGSSFQQLLVVASTNIFRWATTRRVPRPWFGSSVGGAPARYFSYAYLPLPTSPGLVTLACGTISFCYRPCNFCTVERRRRRRLLSGHDRLRVPPSAFYPCLERPPSRTSRAVFHIPPSTPRRIHRNGCHHHWRTTRSPHLKIQSH